MASVFLSYSRDDTDRARPLAAALEKAGHSVWWDLQVRGGAQFSKVIEEALKAADAVIVLWSIHSVDSPWVRDEAAAGRDSGRLVPVTIDGRSRHSVFDTFKRSTSGSGADADQRPSCARCLLTLRRWPPIGPMLHHHYQQRIALPRQHLASFDTDYWSLPWYYWPSLRQRPSTGSSAGEIPCRRLSRSSPQMPSHCPTICRATCW